jgi:hypothetical protein
VLPFDCQPPNAGHGVMVALVARDAARSMPSVARDAARSMPSVSAIPTYRDKVRQ